MAFTERMELVSEVSNMNAYRHVTQKNSSDVSNVVATGGAQGNVNDSKAKLQNHVHNRYDSGNNNNSSSRIRNNNHTMISNGCNGSLRNGINITEKNNTNNNVRSNNTNHTANIDNHLKFFKTKMCPWHFNGRCVRAEGCSYAHCESELRPVFKTKMCDYITDGACPHGGMCIFAHSSEELKPRLNAGDFPRSSHVHDQQQTKGRQRNTNLTSTSDIQMRESYRCDDSQSQRDGRAANSRGLHASHDIPKTKLLAKTKFGSNVNNNNAYFQQKNKYNNNRTTEEQHRCVSSSTTRNFDSDAAQYEYGRSTSTMDSMSGRVIPTCDSEKYISHPVSSPSSISDSVITPFSPISLNAPPPATIVGSGHSPNAACAPQGPPHITLPSPGSSPVTMPAYLGGMAGTPPSISAHYWLQYANAAYIATENDLLVHHSLYRGGDMPPVKKGPMNINNSCAHASPQIGVQPSVLHSQPSDTLSSIPSDQNMLMQGSFNASVEELNAARPAFYED